MTSENVNGRSGDGIPQPRSDRYQAGKVHGIVLEVISVSRRGRLIIPSLLMGRAKALQTTPDRTSAHLQDARNDAGRRSEIIEKDGDNSIGHLGISTGTLNFFGRISTEVTVTDLNLTTITGLESLFGDDVNDDSVPAQVRKFGAPKSLGKDVRSAIREFKSLQDVSEPTSV